MTNEEILRTPAGEPVVIYVALDDNNIPHGGHYDEQVAADTSPLHLTVLPCHLLPLPEDARTVKREGGADVE